MKRKLPDIEKNMNDGFYTNPDSYNQTEEYDMVEVIKEIKRVGRTLSEKELDKFKNKQLKHA